MTRPSACGIALRTAETVTCKMAFVDVPNSIRASPSFLIYHITMALKVFPNGVRQMEISKPTKLGHKSSTLLGRIILVAKFDFVAESDDELSVSKGDVLKLLDRLPNGWVHVESIDKIDASGLVPSLYVDIAVNDSDHPITIQWLHETRKDSTLNTQNTFNDVQVQLLLSDNSPLTINNRPYPLAASVVSYLACEDRFWYRVDVTYSTGEHGYLCRYYLDFFDLHAALRDFVAEIEASQLAASSNISLSSPELNKLEQAPIKLPRLPEPINNQKNNPSAQAELFSKRCKELSVYLTVVIGEKRLQICPKVIDWLEIEYNDQPGFVVDKALNDSNEAIAARIVPDSTIVASKMNTIPPRASELSKMADASCYTALPKGVQRTKSLNNQHNRAQNSSPASPFIGRSASVRTPSQLPKPDGGLKRSGTISIAEGLKAAQLEDSTFSPPPLPPMPLASSSPRTPPRNVFAPKPPQRAPSRSKSHSPAQATTPHPNNISSGSVESGLSDGGEANQSQNRFTPEHNNNWSPKPSSQSIQLLRLEIKTPSNDVIVVKFKQAEFANIYQFKALLSRKVRYSNVYVKFEKEDSYEEMENLDYELFARLKRSNTAFLLLT